MAKMKTIENVVEPKGNVVMNMNELWEYRELFYFFTWRDIKVKYKQTALGFIWTILQPIFMVLIFTFFFNRALHIPSEGLPYSVFAFSGLLLWNFFSAGISNAGNSMVSHAPIIKKIYFPRLIIPVVSVLSAFFDLIISFSVFVIMLIFFKIRPDYNQLVIWWPVAFLLSFLATIGVGCFLSSLTVKYRDVRFIVPFLLQALLFLSPVIYSVSMINNTWIKFILALNPMYACITLFRLPISTATFEVDLFVISLLSNALFLLFGLFYFKKTEIYFADLA